MNFSLCYDIYIHNLLYAKKYSNSFLKYFFIYYIIFLNLFTSTTEMHEKCVLLKPGAKKYFNSFLKYFFPRTYINWTVNFKTIELVTTVECKQVQASNFHVIQVFLIGYFTIYYIGTHI